jgi:hypothetical protein
MTEKRFDILFKGELLAGFTSAQAGENLSRLFRLGPDQVERLMSGGTHVLKRNTDEATAAKYREALQRAGLRAELRATPSAASESPTPQSSSKAGSPWSLAAPGSELLAEDERPRVEAVAVETGHIRLASVFAEDSAAPPRDQAQPPDTSHLSVAEPGADLLPHRNEAQTPDPPDTSAIELAAPGALLGPGDGSPPLATPDTSHLSLAAPGAPLEEIRPRVEPLNPDTSKIQLASLDDAQD